MTKREELAPALPSNQQLVATIGESVASSPTDIKPGQIVLLGRDGLAWDRRRYARTVRLIRGAIWGGLIGGMVLAVSGFWVAGGALYFAAAVPTWYSQYRGTGTLLAIDALMRQGHLDEAERRLGEAAALKRRNPVRYATVAARLASHRGDHVAAIRWWREALPRMKRDLGSELIRCSLVASHALSGDLVEARRVFAELKFPPRADDVVTGKRDAELVIALCSNDLPSLETLHDWARTSLAYSHTGVELAALGWAFDRHGVDDMANFLAREALDRMHYPYLKTWWPELQAWLDARVAAQADRSEYDP